MIRTPKSVDKHVGSRVRMRRMMLGKSLESLAESLGLTFQQVQKYEKGTNRMGASRLVEIANILGVTPAYFFEGIDGADIKAVVDQEGVPIDHSVIDSFISSRDGIAIALSFQRLTNPKLRHRIVALIEEIAAF